MILSYHPCYTGDENRLCAGRKPDQADAAAMKKATAVILPQGCTEPLFSMAFRNCSYIFPDYRKRFTFPGKLGQAELFRRHDASHPATHCFKDLKQYEAAMGDSGKSLVYTAFPLVFKFNWSGEGENVWRADDESALEQLLKKAVDYEASGQKGFVIQEYVETGGRSLRVVIVNSRAISYWRVQETPGRFGTQFSQGGIIDHLSDNTLQEIAKKAVSDFCKKTGINLAGFDILFEAGRTEPLFLEINYFFGRRGLGGSYAYYDLLCKEIDLWIKETI